MDFEALKKAFYFRKLSIEESRKLIEEREKLHEELSSNRAEIERDLLELHQIKSQKKEKAALLSEEIKQKTDEAASLKEKIKQIDARLDELGDAQEANLEEMKKEILTRVQETNPQIKESYLRLENSLNEHRQNLQNLTEIRAKLRPFYEALQQGEFALGKKSFWGFLFSGHPKIQLSKAIHKAAIEAEKILNEIKEQRIHAFLSSFLEEAHKRWNYSLYKDKFHFFYRGCAALMDDLTKKIEAVRLSILDIENDMENLIENCCR